MKTIQAKPEFKNVRFDEVMAVLENDGTELRVKDVAISNEIARLMEGYTENFIDFCKQHGGIPEQFLHAKGSCAIETIAMQLITQSFREAINER